MARPLNIGLLTHSLNPRGGVVHTIELATALHGLGHRVTVMAPAEPGQKLFRPVPCRVELVPVGPAPRSVRELVADRVAAYVRHLDRLLDTERFDLLHAQDGIGGNALADLRERGRVPGFVRTIHHLDTFADPQVMAWQRRAWHSASQCLCVSDLWCETMRVEHGCVAERVSNGVDAARFTPAADARDDRLAERLGLRPGSGPVFLAVGGVEARKNTLRILQAFLGVHASQPDARLVIAGGASLLDHSAYAREFQAVLAGSGITAGPGAAVQITGPLPDQDMPALYRLADALVTPSLNEGFGLVVLESLASGTPVVASRIAPFTEYLDDATCHWSDPGDARSIAAAMEAAAMAPRGQPLRDLAGPLLARFSWRASAERHVQLYAGYLQRLQKAACTA